MQCLMRGRKTGRIAVSSNHGAASDWHRWTAEKKARIVAESFEERGQHIRGRAATRSGASV